VKNNSELSDLNSLREQNFRLKEKLHLYQASLAQTTATNIKYIFYHEQFKKHFIYKIDHWLRSLEGLFSQKPSDKNSDNNDNYTNWINNYDVLSSEDISAINGQIDRFQNRTQFIIVVDTRNNNASDLIRTLSSLENQLYRGFNIKLLIDALNEGVDEDLARQLSEELILKTECIKISDCRLTNSILSKILDSNASEFSLYLNPGDQLCVRALYEFAAQINLAPSINLVYSDEDEISTLGTRKNPFFKPDWDAALFCGQNFIARSAALKNSWAADILKRLSGNQEFNLESLFFMVAMSSSYEQIRHIPSILVHYDEEKNKSPISTRLTRSTKVLDDYLKQNKSEAAIIGGKPSPQNDIEDTKCDNSNLAVTIVIPTHNNPIFLAKCISTLLNTTEYSSYKIILIDHDNTNKISKDLLYRYSLNPNVSILQYFGEFNFSDMMNKAVAEAESEIVVLLNDDVEIINKNWLSQLLLPFDDKNCAIVGAKLLYPDYTIQHSGVVLGLGNTAGHAQRGLSENAAGYFGNLELTRECSAVSAACMAIRRNIYLECNGMDSLNFKKKLNDIDFCLKTRKIGYKVIWTPHAKLIHHESVSCGQDITSNDYMLLMHEVETFVAKWDILSDPFYNPNLSIKGSGYDLSFPPRRTHTWMN
jgi:GT2 family glycosyltransferase